MNTISSERASPHKTSSDKTSSHNPPPICEVSELALVRGNRLLFQGMNFALSRGEALHICGRNGSGKTSLFKMIMGLLPPNKGLIRIAGQSPQQFLVNNPASIAYLGHQTPIKREFTVAENIRLNTQLFANWRPSQTQIDVALDAVGLQSFADTLAGKLSAGQQRRILLSRLWLSPLESAAQSSSQSQSQLQDIKQPPPQLWLLDEPLAALDTNGVDALLAQIARLAASGHSFILTSHQSIRLDCALQTLTIGKAHK